MDNRLTPIDNSLIVDAKAVEAVYTGPVMVVGVFGHHVCLVIGKKDITLRTYHEERLASQNAAAIVELLTKDGSDLVWIDAFTAVSARAVTSISCEDNSIVAVSTMHKEYAVQPEDPEEHPSTTINRLVEALNFRRTPAK